MGCTYDGKEYSEGAVVCQAGERYKCLSGSWHRFGGSCSSTNGTQLLWFEGDASPPEEITTTSQEQQANQVSCCETGEDATEDLVQPEGAGCAGVWGYAVGELKNDSRLVAITKDWRSGQASYDKLVACFGDNAKLARYYSGMRILVCAPCLTCKIGIQSC